MHVTDFKLMLRNCNVVEMPVVVVLLLLGCVQVAADAVAGYQPSTRLTVNPNASAYAIPVTFQHFQLSLRSQLDESQA